MAFIRTEISDNKINVLILHHLRTSDRSKLLTLDAVVTGFKVRLQVNAAVLDMDEVRIGDTKHARLTTGTECIDVGENVRLTTDEIVGW